MKCPYCGVDDDRVVDSRPVDDGAAVRRRRECLGCARRFSTYERAEAAGPIVRKRGGTTEPYERHKLLSGILEATKNLDVAPERIEAAAIAVEARVLGMGTEVTSETIGTEVLAALRELDPVAYMRFASVYKGFTSPEDFRRELASLEKSAPPKRRR